MLWNGAKGKGMLRVEWEFERKGDGLGRKWWETNLLGKRKKGEKRLGKIMAIFDTLSSASTVGSF